MTLFDKTVTYKGGLSLPSRGQGIFKEEFHSMHSNGKCPDAIDGVCEHGQWYNVFATKIDQKFYKYFPKLWQIWTNRKWSNPTRKFLQKPFQI